MTAREMDALAQRWEGEQPRRSAEAAHLNALCERWKAESPAGCIPCLLEELE